MDGPWLTTALRAILIDPWCKSQCRSLPKVNTSFSSCVHSRQENQRSFKQQPRERKENGRIEEEKKEREQIYLLLCSPFIYLYTPFHTQRKLKLLQQRRKKRQRRRERTGQVTKKFSGREIIAKKKGTWVKVKET